MKMLMVHNDFRKTRRKEVKTFIRKCNNLNKNVNYWQARVKLTNIQLHKLKFAAKDDTEITLRITKKNFQEEELSHELFLKTRQKTKKRNPLANNILIDTKFSKSQMAKIFQLGGFLDRKLGNLSKKDIIRPCCSFG